MTNNDFGDVVASQEHKRFFFLLCRKCNIDQAEAKDRVKELYKLDSFANVSTQQLNEVVEKLKSVFAKNKILEILSTGGTPEEQAEAIISHFRMEEKKNE